MKKLITIVAAAVMMIGAANAQELANFQMGRGERVVSPEIKGDKTTFRLSANYATQVNLVGAWMENPYGGGVPMKKNPNGI